ncbi:MAG TPA: hypothetical protein VJZ00_11870, partial [Thermoanaerobaculia bacterium]|nr:hypothetical protein [Thermoanaerobaculia bacterium]
TQSGTQQTTTTIVEEKPRKDVDVIRDEPLHPMLVVDIRRRQKRRQIRKLRRGCGKLAAKVQDMIDEFHENGVLKDTGNGAPTVVVVVRERNRRGGMFGWKM